MVALIERAMDDFVDVTTPGRYLVDAMPFCERLYLCDQIVVLNLSSLVSHLPAWLPGMGFKATAAEMQQRLLAAVEVPVAYVREQMVTSLNAIIYFFYAIDSTSWQDCRESSPIVYIEISRTGGGGWCILHRGTS
jgi:hypothetical protein